MFRSRHPATDMRVLSYRQTVRFWVDQMWEPELREMYPHTVFGWLCWMSPFEYAATRPLVGREN